jgi:hypothetical protein
MSEIEKLCYLKECICETLCGFDKYKLLTGEELDILTRNIQLAFETKGMINGGEHIGHLNAIMETSEKKEIERLKRLLEVNEVCAAEDELNLEKYIASILNICPSRVMIYGGSVEIKP